MDEQDLIDAALAVRKNAYARYSNYRVGAALLDERGKVFAGCNVENAAYPEGTCAEANAIAAMIISVISSSLMRRMSIDFSYLSASCPAVAENRKNGRMKSAPATFASSLWFIPATSTPWNVTRITSPLRKMLSLSAPRN